MSNLKSITALTLTAFMLVACNGEEEAAPSTTDEVVVPTTMATTTVETTSAPTTAAPATTSQSTTTTPSTTETPATTAATPTTSATAEEPLTEAGVLAAFDDYAELRRICMADFSACDESTFEGRVAGRLLERELFRAESLAGTGVEIAYFPVGEVESFDAANGSATLDVCDWLSEDNSNRLAGPMSAVEASYSAGRWVFVSMTLLEGENPSC